MESKIEVKKAAAWIKKTKTGDDYYSVRVELNDGQSFWINLFNNKYKKEDKHPSYVTIEDKNKTNEPKQDDGIPF